MPWGYALSLKSQGINFFDKIGVLRVSRYFLTDFRKSTSQVYRPVANPFLLIYSSSTCLTIAVKKSAKPRFASD